MKAIYLGLAILMAGGLVLFGVGSSVNGGLADVFSGGGNSGDLKKQVEKSQEAVTKDPKNAKALQNLIVDRYTWAGDTKNFNPKTQEFTEEGKAQLTALTKNWATYQKLTDKPNLVTASYVVSAYLGLQDAKGAQKAQSILAERQPSAANYLALFEYATFAGDSLVATGAELKARDLATKDQIAEINQQIKTTKQRAKKRGEEIQKQIQQQFAQQQQSAQSGGSPLSPFGGAGGSGGQ
ncbi:MAG: hypothetical protein ACRDKI_07345 [Solirubrobacterales bacterium]